MTKSIKYQSLLPIIIASTIFITVVLFFISKVTFDIDSLRFINAYSHEFTHSIDYWLKIYSSKINFKQYRPTSFFTSYYIAGLFDQKNPYFFLITSSILTLINLKYIDKITKFYTDDRYINILALLTYLASPSIAGVLVGSFTFKYILTTTIFLVFLEDFVFKKERYLKLALLQVFAITCHEATFLFSILYIFSHIVINRKICWKILSISLPSIVYVIMRMTIFKVTVGSGFMTIDLYGIPKSFLFYFKILSSSYFNVSSDHYYFSKFHYVHTVPSLLIISSIPLLKRLRSNIGLYLAIFCSLLLILPFSVLGKHTSATHVIWGTTMFSFIPLIIISNFNEKRFLKHIALFLIIVSSLSSFRLSQNTIRNMAMSTTIQKEISSRIQISNGGHIIIEENSPFHIITNLFFVIRSKLKRGEYFKISHRTANSNVTRILVTKDIFYRVEGDTYYDPYDQKHSIDIRNINFQKGIYKDFSNIQF